MPATELRQLPDEFLACREGNHFWTEPQHSFEDKRRVVFRTRHCGRCGAEQEGRFYRNTGEWVSSPRTSYPVGYCIKKSGRIYRHHVRQEIGRRAYNEQARLDHPTDIRPAQKRKTNAGRKRQAAG